MSSEDEDNNFGVSRRIMLAAIFSLLAALSLIVFLYFYSRYLVRLEERRRRANLYRLSVQLTPHDMVDSNEPGLDPSIIASIPAFGFKPNDLQSQLNNGEPKECSVCLGAVVEDAMVRVLPNCKHMFHVECIDMWLKSHTNCPICRTVVQPQVQSDRPEIKGQVIQVHPSAPPLEESAIHGGPQSEKVSGSNSRLGSFRRLFNGERSSRSNRSCGDEVCAEDLEKQ